MVDLNNIPNTEEEEDELYNVVESLLSKAISGTEPPSDTTNRNNSDNQTSNIEDDLEDIDENLYVDDENNMQTGGYSFDGLENTCKNDTTINNNVASGLVGTGFVTFEGILQAGQNGSEPQHLLFNKVIVFFIFRMVCELISLYLFYTLVKAALVDTDSKLFGTGTTVYFVWGIMIILIGFKVIGPIFDKFIGHEIYSTLYITLLVILCLLYMASNVFIRCMGTLIIIIILILLLITFLLPADKIPQCFNFMTVLCYYTDYKYYTKDLFNGMLSFIGCDKICLILQLLLMCYIYVYRNKELFFQHVDEVGNKWSLDPLGINMGITNDQVSNDEPESEKLVNSAGGNKNKGGKKYKKIKNKK